MTDFLAALGLAIAIEGALYALFPEKMKQWMAMAIGMPAASLRKGAIVMLAIGVGIVWIARS